jgi:hypothetical protein
MNQPKMRTLQAYRHRHNNFELRFVRRGGCLQVGLVGLRYYRMEVAIDVRDIGLMPLTSTIRRGRKGLQKAA